MELNTGLACRRLHFRWPGDDAGAGIVLNAVDAAFAPGTISLITGKTGTGKSTLMHLLAGLLHPTAGEIRADGQPVSRWAAPHRDRWRRQVGIVFQQLALIPDLSVAENLLLPLIPRNLDWQHMQRDIQRQLAATGLAAVAQTPVHALSGGQRQRLALARALVGRPRFLLADEPTAFQDDDQTARIGDLLAAAAQSGAVVVICSHDPRLKAARHVDRRYRLVDGTLSVVAPRIAP